MTLSENVRGLENEWALILGASSGFGEACALGLAQAGVNIFGVHLDRRATLSNVERIVQSIKNLGREALFFNVNAADEEKRSEVMDAIQKRLNEEREPKFIRVFLHSLAFGTLKPFISRSPSDAITKAQMDMTLDVMANSLVYWVQELMSRNLLARGSRIFAMTSAGGQRVWKTYGAVSAAKSALESHIRQLALELGPMGVSANAIRAGVTDTPALRKIPGHGEMIELASKRNPGGRLTSPKDVADAIVHLSYPECGWITGNVIGVDGGEFIVD
jgi:NAD(P)-dependent dehydrogenase (short-subunit alcohol dehydrogenase family)